MVITYGFTHLAVQPSVYEASGENKEDATEIQDDKGKLKACKHVSRENNTEIHL